MAACASESRESSVLAAIRPTGPVEVDHATPSPTRSPASPRFAPPGISDLTSSQAGPSTSGTHDPSASPDVAASTGLSPFPIDRVSLVPGPGGTATAPPGQPSNSPDAEGLGAAPAPPAPPAPPATPATPAPPGWGDPILVENFDGTAIDTNRWFVYHSPDAGQHPRARDRATVDNGLLRLTGGLDSAGRDVSGGIGSTLNLRYGRWEATFRVERGRGYSGVVLLWPQTENWPTDGEIDVTEVTGGDRQDAWINIHNGPSDNIVKQQVLGDFTQWHTVVVEWLPQQIIIRLDGATVFTVNRPSGGFNPIPTSSPMRLALQLDRGCTGGLQCRDGSTPERVTMYVDQVRAWAAPASMLR